MDSSLDFMIKDRILKYLEIIYMLWSGAFKL